jgi:hypothetical protein
MLGQHLAETTAPAAGSLETFSTYPLAHGTGSAIELSGWAERDGAAANCIAIVDGNRIVIGAGASIARRLDLERAKGRSLGLAGWQAVAIIPESFPICAFALFPGESQLAPLSHCQENLGNPEAAKPDRAPP